MKAYLDNAATTKVHHKVLEKMMIFLDKEYGNPSSVHTLGRTAKVAVEKAREDIASVINADAGEIYFNSCGTEANNFAILGITKSNFKETLRKKIITTKGEHHCVEKAFKHLEEENFEAKFLSLNSDSSLNIEELQKHLDNSASLISVIFSNNETGATNNISEIKKIISNENTFFHTDAVQAIGKIPIDVKTLGVNALSASGHKIHAPKGIGFTFVKAQTPMQALLYGGSQERNRRGGTENVAYIVGLAEAIKIAYENFDEKNNYITSLRNHFIEGLKTIDSTGITINNAKRQSPYILSITLSDKYYRIDSETMLMFLDINGIALSNGSACSSGSIKPSEIITNMGKTIEEVKGTLRFSFSIFNNITEIDYALEVINKMLKKYRL